MDKKGDDLCFLALWMQIQFKKKSLLYKQITKGTVYRYILFLIVNPINSKQKIQVHINVDIIKCT